MARVKRVTNGDGTHYGIAFSCPGCNEKHAIPTQPHERGWDFNGDLERPTVQPSILVYPARILDDDGKAVDTPRCHSFVTDGRIQYCVDTTHALSGQTVDLPEIT